MLPDPREDYARFVNGHLKELRDFAACRALVLLGEPGAGKSSELEKEIFQRRSSGEYVERILLREFLTASEVREAVCDAARRWCEAGSPGDLTLAFDGFDEPLFAIGNLADVLERELGRLDTGRLRVLITGRRSVWRGRLETAFARWWPGSATATLVARRRPDHRIGEHHACLLRADRGRGPTPLPDRASTDVHDDRQGIIRAGLRLHVPWKVVICSMRAVANAGVWKSPGGTLET